VPALLSEAVIRLSCTVDPMTLNLVCVCIPGWYGSDCNKQCACTGPGVAGCNEGPTGDGTCLCREGWTGSNCDQCDAYYYTLRSGCSIFCHPDVRCSGHGVCRMDPFA
ncbi:unnamed protein product, partial [Polarella glacialis]